ncbi:MAG: trypsin-like peptidase domain-containing protein [Candidatus Poribacteria bacterium]
MRSKSTFTILIFLLSFMLTHLCSLRSLTPLAYSYAQQKAAPSKLKGSVLQAFAEQLTEVVRQVDPSVVVVKDNRSQSATGVIYNAGGYILTTAQIVNGAKKLKVILSSGSKYKAIPIGTDKVTGIGVIKITASELLPAKFGDSDQLKKGEFVLVIGNSYGLSNSLATGIISGLDRNINGQESIQITAPINPGMSGAPVINSVGEVVGIVKSTFRKMAFSQPTTSNYVSKLSTKRVTEAAKPSIKHVSKPSTSGFSLGNYNQAIENSRVMVEKAKREVDLLKANLEGAMRPSSEGINFAIPINDVKFAAEQLIKKGVVTRGWLGIEVQPVPDALRAQLNLGESGILVTDILKDSPAKKAGIERWDIILEFQGNPIDSAKTLQRKLYRTSPEEVVELLILRKGQQKRIKAKIEALQNGSERPTGLVPSRFRIGSFPNPMTDGTWITYELPEEARLTLEIHNLKGELIREIDLGKKNPGYYTTQGNAAYWDGKDDAGKSVPNGIYICSAKAGKASATIKILVSN